MSYHRLMMENQALFTKLVFEKLSAASLSSGQPKILEYLLSHDGSIQKDIAAACMIEPATVTSLLYGMEKCGLVERRTKDNDKRYVCVYLTDDGAAKARMSVTALETTEGAALKGFSDAEKAMLMDFLRKINKNLKKKEE